MMRGRRFLDFLWKLHETDNLAVTPVLAGTISVPSHGVSTVGEIRSGVRCEREKGQFASRVKCTGYESSVSPTMYAVSVWLGRVGRFGQRVQGLWICAVP